MPQITGTLTNSGDSAALISVPAGGYLQVLGMQLYLNNSAITVTVKTGSTARFTCSGLASQLISVQPPPAAREPLIQGDSGEDLIINLSGGGTVNYNIQYAVK